MQQLRANPVLRNGRRADTIAGIKHQQKMKLIIHIDGGARGNPGPAGAGVSICDGDGAPVFEAGFWLGRMTNNQAEYMLMSYL